MAHELQNRYSALVDAKLHAVLVKKDGVVFNTRFQGQPTAGVVQIPVREDVVVGDYNKQTGATKTEGSTTYVPLTIDKDKAVNEIIDGYDAAAVPDGLTADRLDSAAYALAYQIEKDATAVLEAKATAHGGTEALTAETVYGVIVDMRTALSKAHVPNDGKRFLLVSPDAYALILKDKDHFVHASEMGDEAIATGAVGKIGGFIVLEDTTLSAKTEMIAGHPNWCARATEWKVPVHLQDLNGSGEYIGASAVQGRMVYGHGVTKAKTLLIKKQA